MSTARIWIWGFALALSLRALLLVSTAMSTPVHVVGDFATDYLPRARHLATTGSLPTAAQLPLDFYLRPPGYSLVLAPLAAAGFDDAQIAIGARLLNIVVESLSLALLMLLVMRVCAHGTTLFLIAGALLIQPFSAGGMLLPGPDVLLMAIITAALALLVWASLSEPGSRLWAATALGVLIGVCILLRAEMLVLGLLFIPIWCWLALRAGRFELVHLAALLLPAIAALGSCIAYSNQVQDRWNLWSGGQSRFTERAEIVWLRSWYGDERSKTDIGWYWYRGQHLDMKFVPERALERPADAQILEAVLAQAASAGAASADPFEPLRPLAERNRSEAPIRWSLGIPADHALSMWRDLSIPVSWRASMHALNWRVPMVLHLGLQLMLLVGVGAALVAMIAARDGHLRVAIALTAAVVAARTLLFAATISMPESRYMLPVVPAALLLAVFGWVWLRQSLSSAPLRGPTAPVYA